MKNKRIFAILLAIAMVVTYMPALAFAGTDTSDTQGNPVMEDLQTQDPATEQELAADQDKQPDVAEGQINEPASEPVLPDADDTGDPSAKGVSEQDLATEKAEAVNGKAEDAAGDVEEKVADPDKETAPANNAKGIQGNRGSEEVTVTLDVPNTTFQTNEWITFSAVATGAVDYIEIQPDSTGDGHNDYMIRRRDGNMITSRDESISYNEAGEYQFVAIAYAYGEDAAVELARSNAVKITVSSAGEVGEFSITGVKVNGTAVSVGNDINAKRGANLTIDCQAAENANHYWLDVKRYNEETDDYEWFDHTADTNRNSLSFNTIGLGQGKYSFSVGANGIGYTDNYADEDIILVIEDDLDVKAGEMYLEVSKGDDENEPLITCEEYSFAAYCPGASRIEIYRDYANDKNWRNDNGWDNDAYSGTDAYERSGEYTLVAIGYDENNEKIDTAFASKTMYVRANSGDELALEIPDLPPFITAGGEDLNFSVSKPSNANGVRAEVWFDLDDYEGDNSLFWDRTDEGSLNVSINNDDLREGMSLHVKIAAWGYGYESTEEEIRIPVISEPSDRVAISSNLKEDDTIPVNTGVKVTVTADSTISRVQLFDGYGFWDEEEADEGRFTRDIGFGEAGTYSVFARVLLAENEGAGPDDADIWLTTEPISITATSEGTVGTFDITQLKVNGEQRSFNELEIDRGDEITVEFSSAENAKHYWVSIDRYVDEGDGTWIERDYRHYGDTGQNSITFSTIELQGDSSYRLRVGADAQGYEGRDAATSIDFGVTDNGLPEGQDMLFTVSKGDDAEHPLETGEEFTFNAYCPGAEWIEVYMNYDEDRGWNRDNGGGDAWTERDSYGNAGTYKLVAIAHGDEDGNDGENIIATVEKTMYVEAPYGPLEISEPEGLPQSITEGEGLDFTMSMPQHGNHMKVSIWYDMEDEVEDHALFDDETDNGSLEVSVPADKLHEKMTVIVALEAWGRGYEGARREFRIPVIGEASDAVNIQASENTTWINKDIEFTVTAGGERIDSVMFFDGYGLWDPEEPEGDNKTEFKTRHSFDEQGVFTVYARVRLEGADENEWLTTEPITVTVLSKGNTGNFQVTEVNGSPYSGSDPVTVARGEFVAVTYTESENADHYWIDVDKYCVDEDDPDEGYWEWFEHFADTNQLTANLGTAELEPGEYRLRVCSDAEGYERCEADGLVMLTVTEGDPDEDFIFNVSKNELLTNEDFTYSAYCPSAVSIRVFYDKDEDDNWTEDFDGDSCTRNCNYDRAGTYNLTAIAYDEDGAELRTAAHTMTVTAPNGTLSITQPELPTFIEVGTDKLSFTVEKPENASSMSIRARKEGTDDELYDEWVEDESVAVEVPTADMAEGDMICIEIGAFGLGYDSAWASYSVPVITAASDQVKITGRTELLVNEAADYTITSVGGTKITNVQFFDGRNFQEEKTCDDVEFKVTEQSFGEPGSHSVYARVKLEGGSDWLTTEPLVVNVTSHGTQEIKAPELPTKVCTEGDGLTVTFARPEGAYSYGIEAYYIDENDEYQLLYGSYDNENGDISDVWAGPEDGDTLSLDIPANCLSEGMTFYVKFKGWAVGYQYNEKRVQIKAVKHYLEAHEAVEATYTSAGNIAYWSCDGCGKYFKDANGTIETTLDEVTIPVKDQAADQQAADQGAADKVAKTLSGLPAASAVTVADNSKIKAARAAYNALTAAQKKLVSASALKKLTDAEKALTVAQKAAAEYAANNGYIDPKLPMVKIKGPKKAKKSFTAKWKKLKKKQQKVVKGIEIEYSLTSDFKNPAFKTASKKKTSVKVKKLLSKKTYYVRAHTYVYRGGKKYVSYWSTPKKVKVK